MKRALPAAISVVFRAFVDANELAKRWGPAGFTTPSLEFVPRVGESYRIEMQPPEGDHFYLTGEFREAVPPTRLVYTFIYEAPDPDDVQTLVSLSFRDRGESTEVAFTQSPFKTEARRTLHRDGWMDSFDKSSGSSPHRHRQPATDLGLSLRTPVDRRESPVRGAHSPWQHRGNTRCSICVRCVRESALFGRSGRSCKHLARVYEVEGLVGLTPRGGSSPLERIGLGWNRGVRADARWRAGSSRRTVRTSWQQTALLHGVDDRGASRAAKRYDRPVPAGRRDSS